MMNIVKTQAEITNVNPRKENGDDGGVLASDVSVTFSVPREVVDDLFAPLVAKGTRFTDQFFHEDDTRLECVYPITYAEKIKDLRVTMHKLQGKPTVFEGAKIARGMKLTPIVGQYVKVEAKLQLYPTEEQSGKLDKAVKEFVDLEIAEMTVDFAQAANG